MRCTAWGPLHQGRHGVRQRRALRHVKGTASPHVQVDGPLLDKAAVAVLQSFAKAQAGASST
jgi:hypothetical protein